MGLPRNTSPRQTDVASVPPKAKEAADVVRPAGGQAGEAAAAACDPEAFTKAVQARYPRIMAKLAE